MERGRGVDKGIEEGGEGGLIRVLRRGERGGGIEEGGEGG